MRIVRVERGVHTRFSLDAPIEDGSGRLHLETSVEQGVWFRIISRAISEILCPHPCRGAVLSCFYQRVQILACGAIAGEMIAREPCPDGAGIIPGAPLEYVPEPALPYALLEG